MKTASDTASTSHPTNRPAVANDISSVLAELERPNLAAQEPHWRELQAFFVQQLDNILTMQRRNDPPQNSSTFSIANSHDSDT